MMYIKNTVLVCSLLVSFIFLSGCVVPRQKGQLSANEALSRTRIENVETLIGSNIKDKLDQVAAISYGVDYALNKEVEPSENVLAAKDINTRAMSLTGIPSVEEMKNMRQMIDNLTSQLMSEREKGVISLRQKDAQIYALQLESRVLVATKDAEIRRYMKMAQDVASRADAIQYELDKMDRFMGMGAIWYGVKRLMTRLAWILGIGSILFIVLRVVSMSNPIAASIFSIFNIIGSWFINILKVLFPKALELAGGTATSVFNTYRTTMFKIIDGIQTLKERQKDIGNADRKFTLDELLTELQKTMGDDDKKLVDEIKRNLGYN
jgi:hypothetical protein